MPDYEPDQLKNRFEGIGSWVVRMSRGGETDSRKTVSFGDAAAVRSSPLYSSISLVLIVFGWWFLTTGEDPIMSPRTFPSMSAVWDGFLTWLNEGYRNTSLWENTWASLRRVGIGMIGGIVIGVPIGFAMGLSSRARGFFDTPVELLRPIPPLALLPLFIIWFGIGDKSAWRLLVFASVWIMIIAARAGVRTVNLSKVRAAYSLGATKPQVLRRVILPNALPELFTGVRVALGVSWGTLVAAELVGTEVGLGSVIFIARSFFRTDIMIIAVIIISVIGVLMDVGMRALEARLIPWRGQG